LSAGQSGFGAVNVMVHRPPAAIDPVHVLVVTTGNVLPPVIPELVTVTADTLLFWKVDVRPVELTKANAVTTGAFSVRLNVKLAPVPIPPTSEVVTVPEYVPPLLVVMAQVPQVELPAHVLLDPEERATPAGCVGDTATKMTPDALSPLLTNVQVVDAWAGDVAGDTVLQLVKAKLARLFSCSENDADALDPNAGVTVSVPAYVPATACVVATTDPQLAFDAEHELGPPLMLTPLTLVL
jgi:hypothetical protein